MTGEDFMTEEVEIISKIDDKGRVTIHKDARDYLGIVKGDFLILKVKKAEKEE